MARLGGRAARVVAAIGLFAASQPTACGSSAPSGGTPVDAGTEDATKLAEVCAPGQQIACACPGGGAGAQVCASNGQSYGACTGCDPSSAEGGVDATTTGAWADGGPDSGIVDDSGVAEGDASEAGGGSVVDVAVDGALDGASDGAGASPDAGEAGPGVASVTIDDCPGALDAGLDMALEGAGSAAGTMTWLYPYDGTVFPGGIPAPILQWSQTGTPQGVYLHMHSTFFDYRGCFAGASPTRLTVPSSAWQTAWAQSQGKSDPLTVELATSTGGALASVTTTWTFATEAMVDDVYYNTYGSKLLPGGGQNGAVMRVAQGATAPTVFLYTPGASPFGPCISCHSVSANGSYLVAQQHYYPGGLQDPGSMSWDLATQTTPSNANYLANSTTDDWGFSAMYPDGTFLLTAGEPQNSMTGPMANPVFPAQGNNPGMLGPKVSVLYSTLDAGATAVTGLDTPYAMMPMFSTDGRMLVYNDNPGGDAGLAAGGKISIASFDETTMTFSNPHVVYSSASLYPGWPSFTPDGRQVVFALGNGWNYASAVPPDGLTLWSSDIYVLDVASGTAHRLDEAAGFDGAGHEYLPFPGRDEDYDFYPTVSPVAAGGYYWVYFMSRRSYGNVYPGSSESDTGTKAIWVSAIDPCAPAGTDPSHPAFYLPGQEVGTGNFRPVAVPSPCSDGGSCPTLGSSCP